MKGSAQESTCQILKEGLLELCRVYKLRLNVRSYNLNLYFSARFYVIDKHEERGLSFKYNAIERRTVISTMCVSDLTLVHDEARQHGTIHFFLVYGVIKAFMDGIFWAIAKRMLYAENEGVEAHKVNEKARAIVKLGEGVRRAFAGHICNDKYKRVREKQEGIIHIMFLAVECTNFGRARKDFHPTRSEFTMRV